MRRHKRQGWCWDQLELALPKVRKIRRREEFTTTWISCIHITRVDDRISSKRLSRLVLILFRASGINNSFKGKTGRP